MLLSTVRGVDRASILMAATPNEGPNSNFTHSLGANSSLMVALYSDDVVGEAMRNGRAVVIPKVVDGRRCPELINTAVAMEL